MTLDLSILWDFNRPEVSEQRLRAALASAARDDALILQTLGERRNDDGRLAGSAPRLIPKKAYLQRLRAEQAHSA